MTTLRQELRAYLRELLADPKYLLLGQSIRDPYGGANKVTRGLTKDFDKQIIDCPISEQAMVGYGIGLALKGYIPIVEIMFANFMDLVEMQLTIGSHIFKHKEHTLIIRAVNNSDESYGVSHSNWNMKFEWNFKPRPLFESYKNIQKGINLIIEEKTDYDKDCTYWTG